MPGVAPRPGSCSVAGRRELEVDRFGVVREVKDVDGGCRGVSGDLTKSHDRGPCTRSGHRRSSQQSC